MRIRGPGSSILPAAALALAGCDGGPGRGAAAAGAAPPPGSEVTLGRPDAVGRPAFGSITGVRELGAGMVLVADGLGAVVVRLDLERAAADTLGRRGGGPGEYALPGGLLAYPGDSTLLVDYGNGRLTVIDPAGALRRSIPIVQGGPGGEPLLLLPRAVDGAGRLYMQPEYRGGLGRTRPDSVPVLRWDPGTGGIDTVTRILADEMREASSRMPGMGGGRVRVPVSLGRVDAWAAGPDGSVAVARSADYRLEWIDEGVVTRGPPVAFPSLPVGEGEKAEWIERFERTGLHISAGGSTHGEHPISISMPGVGGHGEPDPDMFEWAEELPPFRSFGVFVDAGGRAWVERGTPAGERPTFDVFDRDGLPIARVLLPVGRRVAGFGHAALYLVHTDGLDQEHLEAYRIDPQLR